MTSFKHKSWCAILALGLAGAQPLAAATDESIPYGLNRVAEATEQAFDNLDISLTESTVTFVFALVHGNVFGGPAISVTIKSDGAEASKVTIRIEGREDAEFEARVLEAIKAALDEATAQDQEPSRKHS